MTQGTLVLVKDRPSWGASTGKRPDKTKTTVDTAGDIVRHSVSV